MPRNGTGIADLSAALPVEGRAIQNQREVALGNFLYRHIVHKQSHDLGIALSCGIADELGLRHTRQQCLGSVAPAGNVGAGTACALPLRLHELSEGILINGQLLLGNDLARQIDREAERIVQSERIVPRNDRLAGRQHITRKVGQDRESGVDGSVKALFLQGQYLQNIVMLLPQFRIRALILSHGNLAKLGEERAVDAQQLAVAAGAADDAAQDIAAPLIGRNHPIGDHEHSGFDMIRADADRNIGSRIVPVGAVGDSANLVQNGAVGVHKEHIVHALHHAGKSLQPHAGINVFLRQLGIIAVSVVVEL